MAVKIQYGKYVSRHGRLGNANLSRVYRVSKSVGQYTSGSKFMTLAAFTTAVHIPYHDCGSDHISWSVCTSCYI
jgi:hypothetical protein